MKKLFLGIIFLMSLLILSCAGGGSAGSSADSGRVVIAGSRAAAQKTDLESFILKGALGSGELKTLKTWNDCTEMEGCVIELDTGNWTFSLEAKYPSGKTYTYSGKQTATIKSGEDTVVSFILRNQGFPPAQAGVSDLILSNGYACQTGESIAGASVVGYVIGGGTPGEVVALNTNFVCGATTATPAQCVSLVAGLGDGWRLPTIPELNEIHNMILDGAISSVIAHPTTGYIISSARGDATSYQGLHVQSTYRGTGSDDGAFAYRGDDMTYEALGGIYALAVKSFSVN